MANPEISQKTDKTRRKSLGMRLSTSAQFTGQIDRVRQNETLASVRQPQPPIYFFKIIFLNFNNVYQFLSLGVSILPNAAKCFIRSFIFYIIICLTYVYMHICF